jgi:hypothetical protein
LLVLLLILLVLLLLLIIIVVIFVIFFVHPHLSCITSTSFGTVVYEKVEESV